IRDWTPEWYKVQNSLNKLRWQSGRHSKSAPLYSESDVDRLLKTSTPKEFVDEFSMKNGRKLGQGRFSTRRIVDPTPSMTASKPYNTIEFRLSRTVMDPVYVSAMGVFSLEMVKQLESTGKLDVDWVKSFVDEARVIEEVR